MGISHRLYVEVLRYWDMFHSQATRNTKPERIGCSTKSPARPSLAPVSTTETTRPSASTPALPLRHILRRSCRVGCASTSLLRRSSSRSKPVGHELRRIDELPPAAVLRPDLDQELVGVRGDEAASLDECRARRFHDEGHGEHDQRQPLGLEGDDEVAHLAVWVFLGEGVGQGEGQWAEQDEAAEVDAAEELWCWSASCFAVATGLA